MSAHKTPKPVRLNKYIADSGVASRRKSDELIEEGRVKINGKTHKKLGTSITPGIDQVTVNGKNISPTSKKVYYAFHKPTQVVTSMNDPEGRVTVAHYFSQIEGRIYPVGRLDWDSEGLLLMTNDGEFAQAVTHPKEEITKTYLVKVDGLPTDAQLKKLVTGVSIEGGRVNAKYVERIKRGGDKYAWIKIVITEGKNRQVRRMFEGIGYSVKKLQRVAIGHLRIGRLKKGAMVQLKAKDLAKIFDRRPPDHEKSRGFFGPETLARVIQSKDSKKKNRQVSKKRPETQKKTSRKVRPKGPAKKRGSSQKVRRR